MANSDLAILHEKKQPPFHGRGRICMPSSPLAIWLPLPSSLLSLSNEPCNDIIGAISIAVDDTPQGLLDSSTNVRVHAVVIVIVFFNTYSSRSPQHRRQSLR